MADPYRDLIDARDQLYRLTDSAPHLAESLHVPIVSLTTILALLPTLTSERDTPLFARSAALAGVSSVRHLLANPPKAGLSAEGSIVLQGLIALFESYQALTLHPPLRVVHVG